MISPDDYMDDDEIDDFGKASKIVELFSREETQDRVNRGEAGELVHQIYKILRERKGEFN